MAERFIQQFCPPLLHPVWINTEKQQQTIEICIDTSSKSHINVCLLCGLENLNNLSLKNSLTSTLFSTKLTCKRVSNSLTPIVLMTINYVSLGVEVDNAQVSTAADVNIQVISSPILREVQTA
jgi:hypothetical protein